MIGVISKNSEIRVVEEFFELFKTPWEFFVPHHCYDIVIATSDEIPANLNTQVLAVYNSRSTEFDEKIGVTTRLKQRYEKLEWDGIAFPVYGDVASLEEAGRAFIRREGRDSEIVALEINEPTRQIVRFGYDLFQEVSYLLSNGQPPENAQIPTLEIHIALLRKVMLNAGIRFVEIPPVPARYDFMACLTHDVDFSGIREHKCDHTMWGFIYRASVYSLFNALTGRMPWSKCLQNWKAVISLPMVYLGLADDFWLEFERYIAIEKQLRSTFFFIPFKNYPGTRDSRLAPKRRAVKYDVTEIKEQVLELAKYGCEVGLHGIDAWHDTQKAQAEVSRIRAVTGQSDVGVRMHWLYFDEGSPKALEEAGCSYDSTFGYNDAVGFRAGTTQVFCPTHAKNLLELALNIQDTALFYPSRMHLSGKQALDSCRRLIEFATFFGGVLTVNWHTRSLSPERLWGDFYIELLMQLQNNRVWFGTAEEIVTWFRRRRALRFDQVQFVGDSLCVKITGPAPDGQPPFLVRIHHPPSRLCTDAPGTSPVSTHLDIPWNGEVELRIAHS